MFVYGKLGKTNAATLKAFKEAIRISEQPMDFIGEVGQTARFTVEAVGDSLTYQWQYKNAKSGSTWANSSASGNKTKTLKVAITAGRNGQQYRCIITDADGNSVISDAGSLIVE